jgi:hypothetical protein
MHATKMKKVPLYAVAEYSEWGHIQTKNPRSSHAPMLKGNA